MERKRSLGEWRISYHDPAWPLYNPKVNFKPSTLPSFKLRKQLNRGCQGPKVQANICRKDPLLLYRRNGFRPVKNVTVSPLLPKGSLWGCGSVKEERIIQSKIATLPGLPWGRKDKC
uniref:Uncharacterized protein n=1 Tax=Sphaerodactylus townsendi TaxID=933632 RepID=A0ACB8FKE2_9SAUR